MSEQQLHIGYFTGLFYPAVNGVVTVADRLAAAVAPHCEVYLAAPDCTVTRPYDIECCRRIRIPLQGDTVCCPRLDAGFRRRVRARQTDLVHLHSTDGMLDFAKKLRRERDIPIVATLHTQSHYDLKRYLKSDALVRFFMNRLARRFNSCDEIWVLNEGMKQYALSWGFDETKLRVVGNRCDYRPPADPAGVLAEFNQREGLDAALPVYLFVGRLVDYKGIFVVLDALRRLRERGRDFRMYFVGDGPDAAALKARTEALGLTEQVVFPGEIRDKAALAAYYLRAKLFLFPSLYDAFSIVQIEAAAFHTPTVFADGARTSTGFVKDRNMFSAEPTGEALAAEILRIEADPALYERVAAGAFAEMYRTWEDDAEALVACYRDAIARYRAKRRAEQ